MFFNLDIQPHPIPASHLECKYQIHGTDGEVGMGNKKLPGPQNR